MLLERDRTLNVSPAPARAEFVTRLEELDVDVLGELITAADDRLEAIANVDVRAKLERGRARLELALAVRLAE